MLCKLRDFIKDELTGWKVWEAVWFFVCCITICGLSIYWKDTVMGVISATAGVAYTLCNGKGKLSAFFFGIINAVLYGIISFEARFYGEAMINLLYFLPMQFYGFFVWRKNMNAETKEVNKRKMSRKGKVLMYVVVAAAVGLYGLLLQLLGGKLPYLDALTNVISVVAMFISIGAFIEQWVLWFIVNFVSVIMWAISFAQGSDNVSTLVMWAIYLINSVIMYVKWRKETEKEVK